jgi:hypothetical protein
MIPQFIDSYANFPIGIKKKGGCPMLETIPESHTTKIVNDPGYQGNTFLRLPYESTDSWHS